ncbi:MAG TPA: zinc-dependent metalloprotease, partial [Gemmatimonadaceae bacterium]|nr:zinc-dependent metalloprotease [Gemmatimonadaceae bacterium]
MKMNPTFVIAVVLLGTGCAQASGKTSQAPAPKVPTASAQAPTAQAGPGGAKPAGTAAPSTPAPEKKSLASVVKPMKKTDGLFAIYQDTANGSLMMQVSKDKLGKEFIYFTHVVDAPVTAGAFRGAFGTNNVFTVRRHFNRLEFVTQNPAFYFDSANALSRAAAANISTATVAVQDIVAEDSTSYLIKADDLFMTEAFTQVRPTPNPLARPGEQFTLGGLSKSKTRVTRVKNYPANTDVTVDYVFENPMPLNRGGNDVTDARNVSVVVQHSLIEMPKNSYQPRFDDPRVGFFTQEQNDMLSTSAAPYRDMITRWNLVKKDPSAAISEPVEPIVWWIENTTPVEFRDVIKRAGELWNGPFEAAGFRNAVVVKVQPDNADWDAGDIRYNVLRWTSSPNPPFGGYGPSFVNPRTGQIIGADIMLEYIFVTNRVRQEKAFATAAMNMEAEDMGNADGRRCSFGDQLQLNVMAGMQALVAKGATQIEMRDYVNQAITGLILHEMGHTMGLNHNMKASQMLSPRQINDRSITGSKGVMGSVMDYEIVNLAGKGQTQGDYFSGRPGPYDIWAIQFGYTPPLPDASAERARMNALLSRSSEPDLAFGNDADITNAASGIDPRVNVNDMTNDAIGYMTSRFEVIGDLMTTLPARYNTPGTSYHELRNAYLVLSGQLNTASTVIARYIGGVYVDRSFTGQPGAKKPFIPVSRADQKRAMASLAKNVFAPNAFTSSADLYSHLQMQRRGFGFFGTPEDPKLHDRVLQIQRNVLSHVLAPRVQTRITDSRLYGNEYPLSEVMADLTAAIFDADARGNVNTFRQNLQLEYVNRLV